MVIVDSAHEKAMLASWCEPLGSELEDITDGWSVPGMIGGIPSAGWRFAIRTPVLPVMKALIERRIKPAWSKTNRPHRYRPPTWPMEEWCEETGIWIGHHTWHHFAFKGPMMIRGNFVVQFKEGYALEGLRKWLRTLRNNQIKVREENSGPWIA